MVVINFGLECFTNLGLAYIHHSAHILFVYKLVLVILYLGAKCSSQRYVNKEGESRGIWRIKR